MIYKATISEKVTARTLRRCAKKLFSLGIRFVATERDPRLEEIFSSCGLTAAVGNELRLHLLAEMTLCFAEAKQLRKVFFIHGGGFFSVTRTALRLLEETDGVFISCADFDAVAETVADACGAVVRMSPPESAITVNLSEDEFFIEYGGIRVYFSDFSFSIPGFDSSGICPPCLPALAELLEICGFLGDNEIKCELLSK